MKLPPRQKSVFVYGESCGTPAFRVDFPEPVTVHNGETLRTSCTLYPDESGNLVAKDVTTQILPREA